MKEFPKIINGIEVPYGKDILELKGLLNDELPYFNVACIALAYQGDITSLNILEKLLFNEDWCKRRIAVEALGYHSLTHLLSNKLIKLLDDRSIYVVITTLKTISIHYIERAYEKVQYLIKSKNEEIRCEAIACLNSIGREEDFCLIMQIYLSDRSKMVKDEAARYIRNKANDSNWIIVVELLKQSNLARHRVWSCELIDTFGDNSDLRLLKELQNDKDGHVRKRALNILSKIDNSLEDKEFKNNNTSK